MKRALGTIIRSQSSFAAARRNPMLRSTKDPITVDLNPKSGVATMYLNNPPANDLDMEMLEAATEAIVEAEKSSRVNGIILTSKLDWGVFTHGINCMDLYSKRNDDLMEFWDRFHDWFVSWYGCRKPTVAAINGNASSIGCVWALLCDYRIMVADGKSRIGINDTEIGMSPAPCIVDLVRSVVGTRHATDITLGGRLLSSEEALNTGLVNEIESKQNLLGKASIQLEKMLQIPPRAYGETKMRLREGLLRNLTAKKEADSEYYEQILSHVP